MVDLDPVLHSRAPDLRRGLTVVARPLAVVRRRVAEFLREVGRLEPDQYYYAVSELHVTVLSLFTATVEHEPFFAQKERYKSAVAAALKSFAPICIVFEGVTASPGTVMIQGFLENESLNELRDRLRCQLRACGLGQGLDERYRLRTAHTTVARFRSPLSNSGRFGTALEATRRRAFGETTVRGLSLVEHDWYMSHRATKIVKRYRLTPDE